MSDLTPEEREQRRRRAAEAAERRRERESTSDPNEEPPRSRRRIDDPPDPPSTSSNPVAAELGRVQVARQQARERRFDDWLSSAPPQSHELIRRIRQRADAGSPSAIAHMNHSLRTPSPPQSPLSDRTDPHLPDTRARNWWDVELSSEEDEPQDPPEPEPEQDEEAYLERIIAQHRRGEITQRELGTLLIKSGFASLDTIRNVKKEERQAKWKKRQQTPGETAIVPTSAESRMQRPLTSAEVMRAREDVHPDATLRAHLENVDSHDVIPSGLNRRELHDYRQHGRHGMLNALRRYFSRRYPGVLGTNRKVMEVLARVFGVTSDDIQRAWDPRQYFAHLGQTGWPNFDNDVIDRAEDIEAEFARQYDPQGQHSEPMDIETILNLPLSAERREGMDRWHQDYKYDSDSHRYYNPYTGSDSEPEADSEAEGDGKRKHKKSKSKLSFAERVSKEAAKRKTDAGRVRVFLKMLREEEAKKKTHQGCQRRGMGHKLFY